MQNKKSMIMTLHTLTSMHPGSGTELSFVDLPIQREGHTGYPKIEASTLKGCVRNAISVQKKEIEKETENQISRLFGSMNSGSFASAVSFSDARLLFFPVKSALGIFAWVTCPYAVQRFQMDYKLAVGNEFSRTFDSKLEQTEQGISKVYITPESCLDVKEKNSKEIHIILEDYTFEADKNVTFHSFLKKVFEMLPTEDNTLKERFLSHTAFISDDDFVSFVKYSTEVSERIKIDPESGTVSNNALFSEEYLPPECILYSILFFNKEHIAQDKNIGNEIMTAEDVQKAFQKLFNFDVFQIGADETLGKGIVRRRLWEGENDGEAD